MKNYNENDYSHNDQSEHNEQADTTKQFKKNWQNRQYKRPVNFTYYKKETDENRNLRTALGFWNEGTKSIIIRNIKEPNLFFKFIENPLDQCTEDEDNACYGYISDKADDFLSCQRVRIEHVHEKIWYLYQEEKLGRTKK